MKYGMNLYFESAAMIPTLITVGKMLEAMSKGRTTDALKGLMRLAPKTAVLLKDGAETDFSAEGFSVIGLKQQYEMTYPAALLSIDWVLKDPDNAVKCIKKGLR